MATLKELMGESYRDDMTLADIEKALNGKNLADLSLGEYVSVAKYTDLEKRKKDIEKKFNDKMTDDEKALAEQAEREEKYKAIEKENNLYKYKNQLSASIKDAKVLDEVAQLYANGDYTNAINKQNEYFASVDTARRKEIQEELLRNNPVPSPNNGGKPGITKEQFDSMNIYERTELYNTNKELYDKLIKS